MFFTMCTHPDVAIYDGIYAPNLHQLLLSPVMPPTWFGIALEIPGFNAKKEKHHLCMGHIVVHCQVASNNESVFQRSLL
jgi:hypothetical protein